MKRLSAILLIILVLFLGLPRQACACNKVTRQSPRQEHACCKIEKSTCHSSNRVAVKCNPCCGSVSNQPVALASSINPQLEGGLPVFHLLFFWSAQSYISTNCDNSSANSNRAPPRLTGMGTNKTYLYKRTFLI